MTIPSRSQIQWQCRRGMLELDFLLTRFLDKHFDALTAEEKITLMDFLQNDDTQLWDWLVENPNEIPAAYQHLILMIRGIG